MQPLEPEYVGRSQQPRPGVGKSLWCLLMGRSCCCWGFVGLEGGRVKVWVAGTRPTRLGARGLASVGAKGCLQLVTRWPSPGREFPSSFESLVRKICRHLFHVLAHIYWAHFKETLALELHGHLNTLYVHFILFAREFNLLDPKETAIMDDLTEVLCSGAGGVHSGGSGDGAGSGGPGAQNHVKER